MRQEQREHFKKENCLKELSQYKEFVSSTFSGSEILLDLGTGAGYGVVGVAEFVKTVIATDIEKDMVETARETCEQEQVKNVEFRQMAAENIDLKDNSVDIVQIRFSLHHFDNAQKALFETARVIKPGGILILVDAFFPSEIVQIWNILSLLRHGKWTTYFTYRQHLDMLKNSGFEIKKIKPILLEQSFNDFFSTAPDTQQKFLRMIVDHFTEEEKKLIHFRVVNGEERYAYDGFGLIAKKL